MIKERRVIAGVIDNIFIIYAIGYVEFRAISLFASIEPSSSFLWSIMLLFSYAVLIVPLIPICIAILSSGEIALFMLICQFIYYMAESLYYFLCYLIFDCSLGQLCTGLMIVDSDGNKLTKKQKYARSNEKVSLRYSYYVPLIPYLFKGETSTRHDKKIGSRVIFRKEYKKIKNEENEHRENNGTM